MLKVDELARLVLYARHHGRAVLLQPGVARESAASFQGKEETMRDPVHGGHPGRVLMKRALTEAALTRRSPNWCAIVSLVQEHGRDVLDVASLFGNTPLHMSTYHGKPEYVGLMLARGSDPNANQRLGCETPLHLCAMCESEHDAVRIAAMLVQYGAHLNALCDWGRTPLYWAVLLRKAKLVRFLLQRGADPTLRYSADSEHILHISASRGMFDIARIIMSHGGAPMLAAKVRGETPVEAAARAGHRDLATWLAEMDRSKT
jgi:ankyrin repeat protein